MGKLATCGSQVVRDGLLIKVRLQRSEQTRFPYPVLTENLTTRRMFHNLSGQFTDRGKPIWQENHLARLGPPRFEWID